MEKKGYTLIELVVVIALLGLILVISIPRFRNTLMINSLHTTTRHIVGMVKNLRDTAIREHQNYLLYIDIDDNKIWHAAEFVTAEEKIQAEEKAFKIQDDVSIIDVWSRSQGKKVVDEVVIRINRKGYIEKSVLHLADEDGDQVSVLLTPFLGEIKVYDTYMDIGTP